jgi:hypothetical protein
MGLVLSEHDPERLLALHHRLEAVHDDEGRRPLETPALQKTPLNYERPGFRYWNSHTNTNSAFSPELLAFLHFKFCSELQASFRTTRARASHARRGLHYFQLQQAR